MELVNIKTYLEIIYFLSGPIIAIFAFLALNQIKVAKKQLDNDNKIAKINAKRESIKLASEQCKIYFKEIILDINKLDKIIEEKNIQFFSKSKVEIKQDNISVSPYIEKEDFEKIYEPEVATTYLNVMNALEVFAIYFTSGIADEKTAYLVLGRTYCSSVEKLLPALIITSQGDYHNNILQLFNLWYFRLKHENIAMQKEELENELNKIKTRYIQPIGTNI